MVDLICLPLSQLDVTLGMNWLLSNSVFLNCFDKTVLFFGPTNSNDSRFIIANQVDISLKQDAQVFMMLASMKVEREASINNFPIVRVFPKVFPMGINSFPPKKLSFK